MFCAKIRVQDLMMIEDEDMDVVAPQVPCGCLLPHCLARTENGTCLVFAAKMVAAGDVHLCPHAVKEGATALMAALNMNEQESRALAASLGLPKPERHWSTLEGAQLVQSLLKNIFVY